MIDLALDTEVEDGPDQSPARRTFLYPPCQTTGGLLWTTDSIRSRD